jgi:hypothetical protein
MRRLLMLTTLAAAVGVLTGCDDSKTTPAGATGTSNVKPGAVPKPPPVPKPPQ